MSSHITECLCCYSDVRKSATVKCDNKEAHRFCYGCMKSQVNTCLEKQDIELKCMDTSGCTGHFSERDLPKFFNSKEVDHFFKVQQRVYLRTACGDDIVSCPFCSIEMIQDSRDDDEILICINKECRKTSCMKCKKRYHWPEPCLKDYSKRVQEEEEQTYKVIKACPTCNTDILRDGGCSHMKCTRCGNTMCYVCGVDITKDIWGHGCKVFDAPRRSNTEPVVARHRVQQYPPVVRRNTNYDSPMHQRRPSIDYTQSYRHYTDLPRYNAPNRHTEEYRHVVPNYNPATHNYRNNNPPMAVPNDWGYPQYTPPERSPYNDYNNRRISDIERRYYEAERNRREAVRDLQRMNLSRDLQRMSLAFN